MTPAAADGVFGAVLWAALVVLGVAMLVALARLVRGPSLPDRVVALDLTATLTAGTIVVYALAARQPVLLDVAVVIALLGFLSTMAFARYVEQGAPVSPPGPAGDARANEWAGRTAADAPGAAGAGAAGGGVAE